MIHVLEDGLVLEVRGDGGVVLLNCLDVLGSRRSLIFLIIVISLTREIFRTFMLVGRAKLRKEKLPVRDFRDESRTVLPTY